MKFSLIIPMYNAEKYILRCLNSIKNQTYEEFEVLLVDDGSTDNTISCCMKFVDKDERFKIIKSEKNLGVSAARNLGLKEAVGEWIWFVDADDWIESTSLQSIRQVLDDNVDLICVDFIKERMNRKQIISCCYENGSLLDRKAICEQMLGTKGHFQFVWSDIFNHEFLSHNNLFFDEGLALTEDCEFMVRVAKVIHQGKILKKSLYHYVVNMESASQGWRADIGDRYMKSVKKIYESVIEINNPKMIDNFFTFVKDVVRVIMLKDIFHPDNVALWKVRKNTAESILAEPIVKESIARPYIGRGVHRIIWILIKYKIWIMLAVISNLYYKTKNKLFWKLYMKIYGV